MHGNMWEWCLDRFAETLPGGNARDPDGPAAGPSRVFRSGSWINLPRCCRAASRRGTSPEFRRANLGFRVAVLLE